MFVATYCWMRLKLFRFHSYVHVKLLVELQILRPFSFCYYNKVYWNSTNIYRYKWHVFTTCLNKHQLFKSFLQQNIWRVSYSSFVIWYFSKYIYLVLLYVNNVLFLVPFQLSNFNSFEGVLYCRPHFDQLFKRTGSLDKSFEGN